MKSRIIVGTLLLLCSCYGKYNLIGKYMSKNNPNYIQLRSDSTFIYEYRALHLYQQSIGEWKKEGKNLVVLNSEIKSTTIPLIVSNLNSVNGDHNTITIKLNIKDSRSLVDYNCRIYINDSVYCVKHCDSLSFMSINSPINSIYFMFFKEPKVITTTYIPLPVVTNKYNPKEKNGNNLKIKVDFSDTYFYYKAFNNDTLKTQRNAIKMLNSYKSKWEKLSRVSDVTNLFSRYKDTSTKLNTFR